MRLFHRAAPPEEESSVEVEPAAPTLPADPVELGLLLRATRERLGIRLEAVRDEIDVPLVDLDALERGQLETLHTQQAAVIALWRYAERLGLDASGLVGILRSHWPNRVLAVNSIVSRRGFTPIAELRTASQLLSPISDPVSLGTTMSIGLSQSTKEILEARSAKHLFALQLLAPAIALQRSQLGSSPMSALRAASRVEITETPQLSAGDAFEDDDVAENGSRVLDDRAVLERFMASTAAPEELIDEFDLEIDLVGGEIKPEAIPVEEDPGAVDGPSVEWFDTTVVPVVPRSAEPDDVDSDEIDDPPAEAIAVEEPEVPAEPAAWDAMPENHEMTEAAETPSAPYEPLTISQPSVLLPSPSPAAQAVAAAGSDPAPLIPSFGELLGRSQSKNRWVRYVSKFVADRLGITPEGTAPGATAGGD